MCSHCNIEKNEDFYNKYTSCKICNSRKSLNRYYANKVKLSSQRKIYSETIIEKLLQKQNIAKTKDM